MKFEHDADFGVTGSKDSSGFEKTFKRRSKYGWEMVSVTTRPAMDAAGKYFWDIFWKRPVE